MQRIGSLQALDGLYPPPLHLGCQGETGEHRPTVDQDGAGAAFAQLAAVFGAGQAALLAQHLEQRVVGGEGHGPPLAVDE
jgi:hypothetical protein